MARRKRRNHSPTFKVQVAPKSDKTLAELARQFDIRRNHIADWKAKILERAAQVLRRVEARGGARLESPTRQDGN